MLRISSLVILARGVRVLRAECRVPPPNNSYCCYHYHYHYHCHQFHSHDHNHCHYLATKRRQCDNGDNITALQVLKYNTAALQNCNTAALQHHSTAALQLFHTTTLQRYDTTTLHHYNTTTPALPLPPLQRQRLLRRQLLILCTYCLEAMHCYRKRAKPCKRRGLSITDADRVLVSITLCLPGPLGACLKSGCRCSLHRIKILDTALTLRKSESLACSDVLDTRTKTAGTDMHKT